MEYLIVKWIHIVSSTILFGTGLGSAFYKYIADRQGELNHIALTNKNVVLADWLFTTPTIILQPVTGVLMVYMSGYSITDSWLLVSIILYLIAGACWLLVVVLQIKMRDLAMEVVASNKPLDQSYFRYARLWFWLGVPAFIAMVMVFYLMVNKPMF